MILGINAFRMIKPVNSIDDYESGTEDKECRAIEGEKFLVDILKAVDGIELSVPQVAAVLGRSRAAIQKRLLTQVAINKVSKDTRRVPGINKPVSFYQLIKVA